MTVVLEAEAALAAPTIPETEGYADDAEALEDIIAAHRAVLRELAPHQAWRSVRVDTGWHMEHLGLLLCHRDAQTEKAPPGMVPDQEGPRESTGTDRLTH